MPIRLGGNVRIDAWTVTYSGPNGSTAKMSGEAALSLSPSPSHPECPAATANVTFTDAEAGRPI
jgi:hypothetical protein